MTTTLNRIAAHASALADAADLYAYRLGREREERALQPTPWKGLSVAGVIHLRRGLLARSCREGWGAMRADYISGFGSMLMLGLAVALVAEGGEEAAGAGLAFFFGWGCFLAYLHDIKDL